MRGHSLTWCSVAQLEPLATLQDAFGSMVIEQIEDRLSPEQPRMRSQQGPVYGPPLTDGGQNGTA